jgi:Transglycosylase SLT domain
MKGVEEGIRSFASYLGGDDFKNDMKDFIDGIKVMGDTIRKFVGTLSEFTSDKPPGDDASPLAKAWWDAKQAKAANDDFFKSTLGDAASSGYVNSQNGTGIANKDSLAALAMKWYAGVTGHDTSEAAVMGAKGPKIPMDQAKMLFSKLEMAKGLQPNLLSAIAQNESGFNPSAVSSKGAVGLMQLMPQVSRNLGVTNPLDWIQNSMGGAELMGQLKTRYGGDLKKQLAAWNWNPSDLDADIKKNGADWDKHLPKETEDFIRRVAGTLAKNAGAKSDVNITITNKSGTNVAMSVNAGSK